MKIDTWNKMFLKEEIPGGEMKKQDEGF